MYAIRSYYVYRSGDYKEITSLGVLDEFKKDLTSPEAIMNLVGNKTAYSAKDIRNNFV